MHIELTPALRDNIILAHKLGLVTYKNTSLVFKQNGKEYPYISNELIRSWLENKSIFLVIYIPLIHNPDRLYNGRILFNADDIPQKHKQKWYKILRGVESKKLKHKDKNVVMHTAIKLALTALESISTDED